MFSERFEVYCAVCGKKITGFNTIVGLAIYFSPSTTNETLDELSAYYNPTNICEDCRNRTIGEVCDEYEYKRYLR